MISSSTTPTSVTASSTPLATEDPARWFKEEIQPHERELRGYLRNAFPSVDVDDVVQESYLRLLKAKAAGRMASTRAYLFTIVRNTARTLIHRRRIFSTTPLGDLPDSMVVAEKADVTEHLNDQFRFDLAIEAIDQLPSRCREIFRLAMVDRLSATDIVRRTGLAENTVYAQLAIGVRKCSEYLRAKGEKP